MRTYTLETMTQLMELIRDLINEKGHSFDHDTYSDEEGRFFQIIGNCAGYMGPFDPPEPVAEIYSAGEGIGVIEVAFSDPVEFCVLNWNADSFHFRGGNRIAFR